MDESDPPSCISISKIITRCLTFLTRTSTKESWLIITRCLTTLSPPTKRQRRGKNSCYPVRLFSFLLQRNNYLFSLSLRVFVVKMNGGFGSRPVRMLIAWSDFCSNPGHHHITTREKTNHFSLFSFFSSPIFSRYSVQMRHNNSGNSEKAYGVYNLSVLW